MWSLTRMFPLSVTVIFDVTVAVKTALRTELCKVITSLGIFCCPFCLSRSHCDVIPHSHITQPCGTTQLYDTAVSRQIVAPHSHVTDTHSDYAVMLHDTVSHTATSHPHVYITQSCHTHTITSHSHVTHSNLLWSYARVGLVSLSLLGKWIFISLHQWCGFKSDNVCNR